MLVPLHVPPVEADHADIGKRPRHDDATEEMLAPEAVDDAGGLQSLDRLAFVVEGRASRAVHIADLEGREHLRIVETPAPEIVVALGPLAVGPVVMRLPVVVEDDTVRTGCGLCT